MACNEAASHQVLASLVEVHYCMEPTPITMYLGRVTVTSDL